MLPQTTPCKAVTLSALVLTLTQGIFGQIQTGRISGTIYDPNKAAVPNTTLIVKNTATNVTEKIVGNESGGYVVPPLNPGICDIRATAAGFRTTVRFGEEMQVVKDLLLDIDLVDPTAFVAAPNFTYGNAGLRILSPDIVRTIDFSLFKHFQIAERSRLQFRFEVFNLPNTPSSAAPNSTVDTATAGRVTSTSTAPRQMQVALRLTF